MTVSEDAVAAEGRISGWVLKGSETVPGLACWRFAVLEKDRFLYYRNEKDEKPSAAWKLSAECDVSKTDQKDIHVRAKGKNTFVALVAGRYGKIEGYQFSVTWPSHLHQKSGKGNRVILGFKEETTAAKWQTWFLQCIEDLMVRQQEAEIVSPPLPMDSPPPLATYADQQNLSSVDQSGELISFDSPRRTKREEFTQNKVTLIASQTTFYDVDPICQSLSFSSSTAGGDLSADASHRVRTCGFWSPWKHVNGVAVYKEDDASEGVEAFMVSSIIRSSPRSCFFALMAGNDKKCTVGQNSDFLNMNILDKLDENVDVVHGCLAPRGWTASFLAPREIVLERNWRKDEEDGPYTVVLKSTEKFVTEDLNIEGCQEKTIGRRLWKPVRAQVLACVFTISSLKEKYYPNASESPEALVTMVLKIDLGGVLSPKSYFYPLSQVMAIKDSWIESILMTVVSLRDRVEQSRFMSSPFAVDSTYSLRTQSASTHQNQVDSSDLCPWSKSEKDDFSALNASENCPRNDQTSNAVNESSSLPSSSALRVKGLDIVTPPELRAHGTCDPSYWTCPGSAGFRVRGPTYLTDRKKIVAPEPMFDLHSVDLVKLKQPTAHVARFLNSVKKCPSPFAFVLQIMVPGPPHLALVITWGSRDDGAAAESSSMNLDPSTDAPTETEQDLHPFDMALMKFVTGDDEVRNSTFKLIPHITNGSFIIRQSVGSTPVLLGKKLKQQYFKDQHYIEVDVDIGSSYTAATVVNMVSGVTKTLVVDLGVVLEGKTNEELPEALLGTVRLDRLDLAKAVDLDTDEKNLQQQCSYQDEGSSN